MRPVAHDQVGTRVDGRVGDGHLVVGGLDAARYTPVERSHQEVDPAAKRPDVAFEGLQVIGVGPHVTMIGGPPGISAIREFGR